MVILKIFYFIVSILVFFSHNFTKRIAITILVDNVAKQWEHDVMKCYS